MRHKVAAEFVGADIAAYGRRTGLDPAPLWRFGMAFRLFRTAAIQQRIYARSLQGTVSSSIAHFFGESFLHVVDAGWLVASGT